MSGRTKSGFYSYGKTNEVGLLFLWQDERSRASLMRFLGFCLLLFTPMAAAAAFGVFADVQGDTRIQRGEVYLAAAPGRP